MRLRNDARTMRCSIEDDGIGFDRSAVRERGEKGGLGLIGIRERLADLGGTLTIATAPGQGTTLDMTIPLDTAGDVSCAGTPLIPAPPEAELVCRS
jgi:signal transduction histidine kinase